MFISTTSILSRFPTVRFLWQSVVFSESLKGDALQHKEVGEMVGMIGRLSVEIY